MRHKPIFGKRPFGRRDASLLIVAYFDPNGIETISEGIASWQFLSRHEIQLLNLWPGRNGELRLPEDLDLRSFDGIIIHPTISYFPNTVRGLDIGLKLKLSEYDGVKILMKQDEQVHSGELSHLVADLGFDIVFSCLPETEQEKVYPRAVIGDNCIIYRTLTGYVSPKMRAGTVNTVRNLGVTYRGSIQPLAFGRLGYEKRGIGYEMAKQLSNMSGIAWDISSRWEDRLTGSAWDDFLNRSSIVLGVESGSNIFDFDGSVARWCQNYSQRFEGEDESGFEYYKRAHDEFLHTVEGNVNYAQISPRHLEAAAAGAAQLLYEGEYSGIFVPNVHFFPLKRNLKNFDAVMDFVRDDQAQSQMARRTFEDIILNKRLWYEKFVSDADELIDKTLLKKGFRTLSAVVHAPSTKPSAFIVCAHDPKVDSRVEWFANSLSAEYDVTVIGTCHFDIAGDSTSVEKLNSGVRIIRVERTHHEMNWVPTAGELRRSKPSVAHLLLGLVAEYARLPTELLKQKLGGEVAADSEIERFRSICEYVVNTNSALLGIIELVGAPNLLIGVDFEALFSVTICGETLDVPVVFDAREYWPRSHTDFQHWEIEFWSTLIGKLSQLAALNIAVTPQLADIMGREYFTPFRSLPNASSLSEIAPADLGIDFERTKNSDRLQVLYQGAFSEGRGLEELVRAWTCVTSDSELILCGPHNGYRDRLIKLARSLGLGEDKITFPPAADVRDLIATASRADVGVIPYNPTWFGYRYCCPKKLSRYAAAGLPILTSRTEFVSSIVQQNDIGFVVDFSNPTEVARLIDDLAGDRALLIEKGRRARTFFENSFNWEELGREVFRDVALLCKNAEPRRLNFERVDGPNFLRKSLARYKFDYISNHGVEGSESNVLLFDCGARLVSSSPFHPFPHDAGHVLRRSRAGYSAALESVSRHHWMEFELGDLTSIGGIQLTWFDKENRANGFKVLLKEEASCAWMVVVEEADALSDICRYEIIPTKATFVRIETNSYIGEQRMILRSFQILKSQSGTPDGNSREFKRVFDQLGSKRVFRTIGPNPLRFDAGAMVVGSSAFCDWPNDPGYLLRDRAIDGYAAGILGAEKKGWIEFCLGMSSRINTAIIEWYSDENRAICYKIFAKNVQDDRWAVVVDVSAAENTFVRHNFDEIECRFIRIETTEYKGQMRMLLRRFELFYETWCEG